jgi:hypothetical protein
VKNQTLICWCILGLAVNGVAIADTEEPDAKSFMSRALIRRVTKPFTGDLPAMKKRRLIRVLVNYSRRNE